jgi:hypothetical protein
MLPRRDHKGASWYLVDVEFSHIVLIVRVHPWWRPFSSFIEGKIVCIFSKFRLKCNLDGTLCLFWPGLTRGGPLLSL